MIIRCSLRPRCSSLTHPNIYGTLDNIVSKCEQVKLKNAENVIFFKRANANLSLVSGILLLGFGQASS